MKLPEWLTSTETPEYAKKIGFGGGPDMLWGPFATAYPSDNASYVGFCLTLSDDEARWWTPDDREIVMLLAEKPKISGDSILLEDEFDNSIVVIRPLSEADTEAVGIAEESSAQDVLDAANDFLRGMFDDGINSTPEAVVAAAAKCPVPTQDIALNLANRQKAIDGAGYGPLNPNEPNVEFWREKADRWSIAYSEAKRSICGNCAAFIKTPSMLDCIASGLSSGGTDESGGWDTIEAGELGYCEAFDFKCAASRTCDAWIVGGPVTEEK
jgi:hypothetical protein